MRTTRCRPECWWQRVVDLKLVLAGRGAGLDPRILHNILKWTQIRTFRDEGGAHLEQLQHVFGGIENNNAAADVGHS
jgi:hypothetical protein